VHRPAIDIHQPLQELFILRQLTIDTRCHLQFNSRGRMNRGWRLATRWDSHRSAD